MENTACRSTDALVTFRTQSTHYCISPPCAYEFDIMPNDVIPITILIVNIEIITSLKLVIFIDFL
jgi:hypothetical protein